MSETLPCDNTCHGQGSGTTQQTGSLSGSHGATRTRAPLPATPAHPWRQSGGTVRKVPCQAEPACYSCLLARLLSLAGAAGAAPAAPGAPAATPHAPPARKHSRRPGGERASASSQPPSDRARSTAAHAAPAAAPSTAPAATCPRAPLAVGACWAGVGNALPVRSPAIHCCAVRVRAFRWQHPAKAAARHCMHASRGLKARSQDLLHVPSALFHSMST